MATKKTSISKSASAKLTGTVDSSGKKQWTFLSNHGHVLIFLAHDPQARVRDIASAIGITERSTQAILADLEETGYLTKRKNGRRNEYTIKLDKKFRHPSESHKSIRLLLEIFN